MKHLSFHRHRENRWRSSPVYRPAIECLEPRLPPGNMLQGLLFGGLSLMLDLEAAGLEAATSILRLEDPEVVAETLRPKSVARGASRLPISSELVQRRNESTDDTTMLALRSPRTSAIYDRVSSSRTTGMGTPFSGLVMPSQTSQVIGWARGGLEIQPNGLSRPDFVAPSVPAETMKSEVPSEIHKSEILDNYGELPLSFEQNVGQFDDRVDFVSRAGGSTVFLTPTTMVFSMQNSESRIQNPELQRNLGSVHASDRGSSQHGGLTPRHLPEPTTGVAVHMQIVGANPQAEATAVGQLPGITNYLIGNDPTQWHTNIAAFGRVEYDEVYPGIDLTYYGNNGQLEYDFIVSPGADPNAIALSFDGADGIEINPQGDLLIHTAVGDVVQQKSFTYQAIGNSRREIASGYAIHGETVRFEVGNYDARLPLVIDPIVMGYSTFLGGSGVEGGGAVAVDASGSAYIVGGTDSANFPTKPGAFDTSYNGSADVFVTKLNPTGTGILYSTYLGGTDFESGYAIATDSNGFAYVTGLTLSTNFPTTVGAFDTSLNGSNDVFITVLSPSGAGLSYSTYVGGSDAEYAAGIALDAGNNVFITGETQSTNYPTTAGSFDTTYNGGVFGDVFITKLKPIGFTALTYSTFLGGLDGDTGTDIAVDPGGSAYVTGWTDSLNFPTTPGSFDTTHNGAGDAFVTKLNPGGSALVYSTYLGGINSDLLTSVAIDPSGNAYVTGNTTSGEYPITPGAFSTFKKGTDDAVVTKLNSTGSALVYSTFLGGAETEIGANIKVDANGNAFVTGQTTSFDFPTTSGALDATFNQGVFDVFVTKLNPAGSGLGYSTYLGGTGEDFGYGLATDATGSIYVTGYTESPTFPTTLGASDVTLGGVGDGYVTKFRVIRKPCGCFDAQTISTAADGAYDVFAVDFDRDGDTDVLSASNFDKKFRWYENNGSQSFTPHTINADWTGPTSVFAADRDGDGDTDVLFAASGIVGWFVNDGNQGFSGTHIVSNVISSPRSVYAKDVDGDGDMDVLSASAFDDKIAWYENVNNAFFTRVITTAANGAQSVIATDVDDDGDIDVLSASRYDNKIAWYENNGSEVFTPRTITTSAVAANSVYAADVDGDGDLDVLSASYGDNKIAWYENDGNQNFTTRLVTNTFANIPKEVSAADLDGDGDTDVLSASIIDNRIAWYRNNGGANPTFTPFTITTGALGAESVFAADVDGDGDTDVLSASTNDDRIAWYRNRSFQAVAAYDYP